MKNLSFYSKIFTAFIGLAVVPLIIHVLYLSAGMKLSDSYLRQKASDAIDGQTEFMLAQVANASADKIAMFLQTVKSDAENLALAEPSYETYRRFYENRTGTLWDVLNGVEYRREVPLYCEIAFIDKTGHEKLRMLDGVPAKLRDVSNPANTTYLTEDYFQKAMSMGDDGLYVSRLNGWYTPESSHNAYKGVFRFAKKVIQKGEFKGVLVISLDQAHIYELVKHIFPTGELVAETSYISGSYAFVFDDEGWMIAHPKKDNIRGLDADGNLMLPYSKDNAVVGEAPFNLLYSGFVHKNYPMAASNVRVGVSGVTGVTNVGGVHRMLAYAPIPFYEGEYSAHRIFGGVAIGAEAELFHKAAKVTSDTIRFEFKSYIVRSWIFVSLVLIFVIYVSYRLARGVVRPINILSDSTKKMAEGKLDTVADIRGKDEIGHLARSFNSMARSLNDQRKHLEDSLEELEKSRHDLVWEQVFKTTVFENIDIGIITIDNDNLVTFMNATARDILGVLLFEEDIDLFEIMRGMPQLRDYVAEGLKANPSQKFSDYVDVSKEQGKRLYHVAVLPLAVGSYNGNILTIEDVTERMGMRAQIERMERLASLGRLSAGLAHEIRNPLTGVSILLDDLHDMLLEHPEEQKLIQMSLSEIERLERLVNELLSFARVTTVELHEGDLASVVDDVVFLLEKQYEQSGVTFQIDIAPDIPMFLMDESKLKQAFLNLIKNGAEAMPDGGVLTVRAYASDDNVYVHIKDSGVGIPDELMPLIFEPFYTSKGEGSGLGLAITHNIITDHNGEIRVESVIGEGSEFIISLPI